MPATFGSKSFATTPVPEHADSSRPVAQDATRPVAEAPVHREVKAVASSATIPTSYRVMIKTPESRAAMEDLVEQLRSAGEEDFLVYSQTRRISLGVFETLAGAEKRRQEVESLGFNTHTLERFR